MKLLSFGEIVWDIREDKRFLGGAPLNLAAHAALQGMDAYLLSAVGEDELGREAYRYIGALGVHTDFIKIDKYRPTGQCFVTLNEQGLPIYQVLENVAYDGLSLPHTPLTSFDMLSFGSMALRTEDNRNTLTELLAKNHFSEIYTDLNIRPPFYSKESISLCLSLATIAKISDEEMPLIARLLYGKTWNMEESAKRIAENHPNLRLLLITMGSEGAFCYDCKEKKYTHCPASPTKVVSTVGAGDSFGATFLAQYCETKDISYALQLAAKVSAFVVSHAEAIPEGTREFLKNILPR